MRFSSASQFNISHHVTTQNHDSEERSSWKQHMKPAEAIAAGTSSQAWSNSKMSHDHIWRTHESKLIWSFMQESIKITSDLCRAYGVRKGKWGPGVTPLPGLVWVRLTYRVMQNATKVLQKKTCFCSFKVNAGLQEENMTTRISLFFLILMLLSFKSAWVKDKNEHCKQCTRRHHAWV